MLKGLPDMPGVVTPARQTVQTPGRRSTAVLAPALHLRSRLLTPRSTTRPMPLSVPFCDPYMQAASSSVGGGVLLGWSVLRGGG